MERPRSEGVLCPFVGLWEGNAVLADETGHEIDRYLGADLFESSRKGQSHRNSTAGDTRSTADKILQSRAVCWSL